jgi:hypothetical protein
MPSFIGHENPAGIQGAGELEGMKESAKRRRYTIGPAPDRQFHVGRAPDGRQFILGPMFSEVAAYVFDADGRLVSRERRTWRETETSRNGTGTYWLFQSGTRSEVERKIADWKCELGLVEAPIVIDGFFDAESNVGIEDMPSCLEAAVEGESDLERCERDRARIDWIRSERFVFWWELDYWMAMDGTI